MWLFVVTGLLFIIMGLLIGKFPKLLNYNYGFSLKRKIRGKSDLLPLATSLKKSLIILGCAIVITYFLFDLLGLIAIYEYIFIVLLFGGVTVIFLLSLKHDKTVYRNRFLYYARYAVVPITLAFMLFFLIWGAQDAKLKLKEDSVVITGMYGETISYSEIQSVELSLKRPSLKIRKNGLSMAKIRKGIFLTQSDERVKLFIREDDKLFLILTKKDGEKIYYGIKSEDKLDVNSIMSLINNKL